LLAISEGEGFANGDLLLVQNFLVDSISHKGLVLIKFYGYSYLLDLGLSSNPIAIGGDRPRFWQRVSLSDPEILGSTQIEKHRLITQFLDLDATNYHKEDRMSLAELSALPLGTTASILGISTETVLEHRLQALGFRAGKQISVIRKAWLGGPLHVRIGTTEVIMRRCDARAIQVRPD
jgi:ferrous iron transport protein A